jgi:hypothetical protein
MQKIFEFKNKVTVDLWECITEIFHQKDFNWNTYQFINIEFENDTWTGAYEFTFVLLCCGLRVRIPHETEKSKKFWEKLDKERKDWLKDSTI